MVVFSKPIIIIPLTLAGYEIIIASLVLRASLAIYDLISNTHSWNNCFNNYMPSGGKHHSILCFRWHLIYRVKLYKDTFVYYSVHSGYFSPQALRLSQASLKETTTGQIVNLVTSDIQRLEQVNSSTA